MYEIYNFQAILRKILTLNLAHNLYILNLKKKNGNEIKSLPNNFMTKAGRYQYTYIIIPMNYFNIIRHGAYQL